MTTPTPSTGYVSGDEQIQQRTAATGTAGRAYAGGTVFGQLYGPGVVRAAQTPGQDWTMSTRDLKNAYFDWEQKYRDEFRNKLALTDKNWSTASDVQLSQKWAEYVDQSSAYLQRNKSLSPWDILASDVQAASGSLSAPTTKTLKETQQQLTSAADAESIFKQAARSLLGRDPTDEEIATFTTALNAQERVNPQISTVTETTDAQGNVTRSTQNTGGISAQAAADLAERQAQASPEYAEHQAATTLMDWLVSASGGR